jgi:hypothetical protein
MKVYSRRFKFNYQGDIYIRDKSSENGNARNMISQRGFSIKNISIEEFEYMFYCSYDISKKSIITDLDKAGRPADNFKSTNESLKKFFEQSLEYLQFDSLFLDKYFPKNNNELYNFFREELQMRYSQQDNSFVISLLEDTRLKEYIYELHNTGMMSAFDQDTLDLLAYVFQLGNISKASLIADFEALAEWIKYDYLQRALA